MKYYHQHNEQFKRLADWIDHRVTQGIDLSKETQALNSTMEKLQKKLERMPEPKALLEKEPNTLEGIRALRPKGPRRFWETLPLERYRDKLKGAWLGRCAGCTLGANIEFGSIAEMKYLAELDGSDFPMTDYPSTVARPLVMHYGLDPAKQYSKPHMSYVPADDDLIYTILDLLIFQDYGPDFSTEDVGKAWLKYLPYACTAEYAALENLKKKVPASKTALLDNPWLEFIGGDIRADGWGYIAPGRPEQAAEYAFRESYISHRFSGIYGTMFVAAAISAAFELDDPEAALLTALTEIPKDCRTAKAVKWAFSMKKKIKNYQQARDAVEKKFSTMSDIHTDNNLCLTIFGLFIGGRDFTKVIGETVAMGMDNDCTAATAASIFGAAYGIGSIPEKWYKPFNNKQRTYIKGHEWFKIDQTLKDFETCAKKAFERG
jgi:ADP-ribosylglycohydrolase